MIPNGTRFIGIADSVNLTERKSSLINNETQPYTIDDIRGYKVFTALLTQSGGENIQYYDEGTITIGVTYLITANAPGELGEGDFTNVGAPNNLVGTRFMATGTTPNSWGTFSELEYNEGAPIATVLENTIGNIWFGYTDVGYYDILSIDNLFIEDKTFVLFGTYVDPEARIIYASILNNTNIINIGNTSNTGLIDGALLNTPIEIRVYN